MDCLEKTSFVAPYSIFMDSDATKLLVGVPEADISYELHRQVHQQLLIDGMVTSKLEYLLSTDNPNFAVYIKKQISSCLSIT